jgi:hypothetical protein
MIDTAHTRESVPVETNVVIQDRSVQTDLDTNVRADDAWEAHAIDRSIVLKPGTHIIQVQCAVSDASLSLALNNWTITITQGTPTSKARNNRGVPFLEQFARSGPLPIRAGCLD